MKDVKKLCLGCMNEKQSESGKCHVCGFDASSYEENSRWLPLNHILNGKYLIGKVLGEGGFGITYMALDLNLETKVAIKEYFPVGLASRELSGKSQYTVSSLTGERRVSYQHGLEKFMEEARSISQFYHLDGIVAVKEFFFENGTAYMVMEYLDGITLKEYLKQQGGQIEVEEALRILRPVITSLEIVHKAGIVHRDISPDNIMILKDGAPKLIDFGAARMSCVDEEHTFTIILKHGYAPPEQYQSKGKQGPWTDVYAVCATLYRMVTGILPSNALDRMSKDDLETFEQLGCKVPHYLTDVVVRKGMALTLSQRYQNMDMLYQELYDRNNRKKKSKHGKGILVAGSTLLCAALCLLAVRSGNQKKEEHDLGQNTEASTETGMIPTEQVTTEASATESSEAESFPAEDPGALLDAMKEADRQGQNLSAAACHVVYQQSDGSIAGKGTNEYGMLDFDPNVWNNIISLSTGKNHTVGIRSDGTAVTAGDTSNGKCGTEVWKDMIQTAAGEEHTLGLKADGTVSGIGSNEYGQLNVQNWTEIEAIAAGKNHSAGLSKGRVIAVGDDSLGQCQTGEWEPIAVIDVFEDITAGLTEDGRVKLTGDVTDSMKDALKWEYVMDISLGSGYIAGLKMDGTLLTAGLPQDISIQVQDTDIVAIECTTDAIFLKKKDGSMEKQQISMGGTADIFAENAEIKKLAAGEHFLLGLREDGSVLMYGTGLESRKMQEVEDWKDITDIAASGTMAAGLRADGTTVTAGSEKVDALSGIDKLYVSENTLYGIGTDGMVSAAGNMAESSRLNQMTGVSELGVSRKGGVLALSEDGSVSNGVKNIELPGREATVIELAIWGDANVALLYDDGKVAVLNGTSSDMLDWNHVIQIAAGREHLLGLKEDGSVVVTGSGENGQCEVSGWKNVKWITAGDFQSYGITEEGNILSAGVLPGQYE